MNLNKIETGPYYMNNLNLGFKLNINKKSTSTLDIINSALDKIQSNYPPFKPTYSMFKLYGYKVFNRENNANNRQVQIIRAFKNYLNAPTNYRCFHLHQIFLPITDANNFPGIIDNTNNGNISVSGIKMIGIIDGISRMLVYMSHHGDLDKRNACHNIYKFIHKCWVNYDAFSNMYSFTKSELTINYRFK